MVYSVLPTRLFTLQPLCLAVPVQRWLLLAIFLAVSACSSTAQRDAVPPTITPLELASGTVGLEDVAFLAPTPKLLAINEEMAAFVQQYTSDQSSQRQRLMSLHRALSGAGIMNLQYDPFAEGTAIEAFHSGAVNCLSYANLFVTLAREAGLDARYQWVDVRPQWSRLGERVAIRLHVNVMVKLRRHGEEYMADIDPLQPQDVVGTHLISDQDAQALYHSNIAMDALAEQRLPSAWAHATRALQLSPQMGHLWVNLGAVYRVAGQHSEAEQSYLHALVLNPRERSAMTNLAVLYGMVGRTEEQHHWQQKIDSYRSLNPYYYAWKGDVAGEKGDWSEALGHYQKALLRGSQDSTLLYATGLIYYQLQDFEAASRLIAEAIEHATLGSEIKTYQLRLAAVKREHLAGL